jgi:hypothetical protein
MSFVVSPVVAVRRRLPRLVLGLVGLVQGALPAVRGAVPSTVLPRHPTAEFSAAEADLLESLEHASFRFFLEQSDSVTGLVRDRARADGSPSEGKASIAACGFALTAWAIGTERGWIDRAAAVKLCRTQLRFLANRAPRVHGFFYHFMDMRTGERAWNCELSNIDTGLFLAGALTAREYFQDAEITALVNRLYGDVDWNWFLNGGTTFAIGWHEQAGFSRFRWLRYSELMMLTLLGLGASEHPVPAEAWSAWSRGPVGDYGGYHYIQYPALFVHQFTQAYVDFRGRRDAYADYYQNSVLATLAQRQFCADLSPEFPSWSTLIWGITACDSASGYKGGWGGPPRTFDDIAIDGTIAPCAAAGSLPFTPRESIAALQAMRAAYGDRIWKHYGFVDAFNPETGWVGRDVVGIDVGIQLLQAENARTGMVTAAFMRAPEVQRALARAGFLPTARTLNAAEADRVRAIAAEFWRGIAASPVAPESAGLHLTALVAARTLGLVTGDVAEKQADALLSAVVPPLDSTALAQYAAGLVVVQQAFPKLAAMAAKRLAMIDWSRVKVTSDQLGALDRLTVFFQVATGTKTGAAWGSLIRLPESVKPVFVLAPARVRDQLLPGLWLDERGIITGASAAQLAYATACAAGAPHSPRLPDVSTVALWLEHFPAVAAAALAPSGAGSHVVPPAWTGASLDQRLAFVICAANRLVPDCIRTLFQRDPLVKAGRAAIGEFGAEEFGSRTSSLWRYELAGPVMAPPERETIAVAAATPREQWHWTSMRGPEYRDSVADVHPGDPELAMRFAFTWDPEALSFHAEVVDGLPKITKPGKRNGIELFLNPTNDGLVWSGAGSYQFTFRNDGSFGEAFHHRSVGAERHETADGYTLEARIPWRELGVTPRPGLTIAVSPAVVSESPYDWEPALKLNWRYYQRRDERYGLGVLRLD